MGRLTHPCLRGAELLAQTAEDAGLGLIDGGHGHGEPSRDVRRLLPVHHDLPKRLPGTILEIGAHDIERAPPHGPLVSWRGFCKRGCRRPGLFLERRLGIRPARGLRLLTLATNVVDDPMPGDASQPGTETARPAAIAEITDATHHRGEQGVGPLRLR
jgi:hypothetical protein